MRIFSSTVRDKLNQRLGTEPMVVIEVEWTDGGSVAYSDRKLSGQDYPYPFVVEISNFDTSQTLSGGGEAQSLGVTLSDIDGSLRQIIDEYDIHKRPARLYLTFQGLSYAEKVLLFEGQINSDMIWDEGARTLTFSVVSQIEDSEVGFSMDDSPYFPYIEPGDRNKNWPLVFGDVCNIEALQLTALRKGFLATGQGVADPTLDERLCQAYKLQCPNRTVAQTSVSPTAGSNVPGQGTGDPSQNTNPATTTNPATNARVGPDNSCLERRLQEICAILHDKEQQEQYVRTNITIRGGNEFPQNQVIDIEIKDVRFTGVMQGENFSIMYVYHPDLDEIDNPPCKDIREAAVGYRQRASSRLPQSTAECNNGSTKINGPDITGGGGESWRYYELFEKSKFLWLPPGTDVFLSSESELNYIVSLIPGVVTQVAAYRTFGDTSLLLEVPTDYYTVEDVDYEGYTVTQVKLHKALSLIPNEDWDDTLYVSFSSDVGPNPVDVIEWLVEKYTELTIDTASFASVKTSLTNYPCNMAITDRMSVLALIRDIAEQFRCAAVVRNNVISLVYLSKEPTSLATITESDIIANSFQISHTETEALVTRHKVTWKNGDAGINEEDDTEYDFTLRYNIDKYGVTEEEYDYYTQNTFETILKSATFWMIRRAHTWKYVEFSTPIKHLNLELYDAFTLNIDKFPTVKCVIVGANYDGENNTIKFKAWTPVLSGTDEPYYWAWPALQSQNAVFPLPGDEIHGGDGYNFIVRPPLDSPLFGGYNEDSAQIWSTGDKHPSDLDDQYPTLLCQVATGAELAPQLEPVLDNYDPVARETFADNLDAAEGGGTSGEDKEDKEACGGPIVGGGCTYEVYVTYITPTLVPCGTNCLSGGCGGGPCGCGSVTLSSGAIREFHGSHPCTGPASSMCHTFGTPWGASFFANSKRAEIEALKANCGYYCGTGYPYSVGAIKSIPGDGYAGGCEPTTEYGGNTEITSPTLNS